MPKKGSDQSDEFLNVSRCHERNPSMFRKSWIASAVILMAVFTGCHHAEVTCYSLSNPCEPEGIPFYLPKPLLVISKNFRNVEESSYGQLGAVPIPNTFDNQAT